MPDDTRKLANCEECGRLIQAHKGLRLCAECFAHLVAAYERIESVLAETPDISLSELSRQAHVSTSVIRRLARKGRIKLQGTDKPVHCERCGQPTEGVGRFCPLCRSELMLQAKEAAATLQGGKTSGTPTWGKTAHGVARALTRKRSLFRSTDYGTKGKYSP